MPKVNLTYDYDQQLKESSFEPLPPNRYTSVLVGHEFKPATDPSKNAYISWQIKVVSGEFEGRWITKFHNTSLGASSVYFLNLLLQAYNIPMEGNNFDPVDGYGNTCDVMVAIEPMNNDANKMINKIEAFLG